MGWIYIHLAASASATLTRDQGDYLVHIGSLKLKYLNLKDQVSKSVAFILGIVQSLQGPFKGKSKGPPKSVGNYKPSHGHVSSEPVRLFYFLFRGTASLRLAVILLPKGIKAKTLNPLQKHTLLFVLSMPRHLQIWNKKATIAI